MLLIVILVMWFAPKLATVLDVLSRPDVRRAFGGTARVLASAVVETVFFLLLSPIMWVGHTLFLGGLLFGRTIGWIGQTRDDHAVPLSLAIHNLWPQALLGITTVGVLAVTAPSAIPYALFIAGGPLLAIPLAVITAQPWTGRLLLRLGIGRALTGVVVSELFGANAGLGYLIGNAGQRFDTATVLFGVLMFSGLGVAMVEALKWIERALAPWRKATQEVR